MQQKPAEKWAGILQMRVEAAESGRSFARRQYHEGALRIIRPHYLDANGQVTYTVINPGGAYFGADRYLLEFETEKNSELLVTTQSATKVYKTPQGPAFQQMNITVGENSVFEYVPDQLIVYREGSYRQVTSVQMHPTSTLLLSEIITPGWSPEKTDFSYDELNTRTEVKVEGEDGLKRLVVDQLRLMPHADQKISGLGMMEGFTHTGQLLLADRRLDDELFEKIRALAETSDTYTGVSRAGTGEVYGVKCISIRTLAPSTGAVSALHTAIINAVREEVRGQSPLNLRKF